MIGKKQRCLSFNVLFKSFVNQIDLNYKCEKKNNCVMNLRKLYDFDAINKVLNTSVLVLFIDLNKKKKYNAHATS